MMDMTCNSIKFGTDGWRGKIAADFTYGNLAMVATAAAKVLADHFPTRSGAPLVIVGYDRRFMAEDFAKTAAETVCEAGFDVLLSQTYAPTPAFSWAASAQKALGALVITASHNPATYLGLKVKGSFGGSVSVDITKKIEHKINKHIKGDNRLGNIKKFDPWPSYCSQLRSKVKIDAITDAMAAEELDIYVDAMHGAAASGLGRLLGQGIREINGDRDPTFGGGVPEPLPLYLSKLFRTIRTAARNEPNKLRVGLVFDGDGDRIAAVDSEGNFLNSQVLIPILIHHLARGGGLTGEVVKTVSGSDLIGRVAALYNLPLFETPIGYKYIAERMLTTSVLIGGEESGGIGYGSHIPERDALLSALYVLEAIVESGKDLSQIYGELQAKTGFDFAYDRIDLPLESMEMREILLSRLEKSPPGEIGGISVVDSQAVDGYKFRLADDSWLLIRFSGTEPILRLYCEAPTLVQVGEILSWAKDWAS